MSYRISCPHCGGAMYPSGTAGAGHGYIYRGNCGHTAHSADVGRFSFDNQEQDAAAETGKHSDERRFSWTNPDDTGEGS